MPDTSEDAPPRGRGLSPAAWTALSAIAVALIGAVATLATSWWQRSPAPKTEPAAASAAAPPSASPAGPALPDPSAWAGVWSGSAQQPGGQRFRVELTITPGCAVGRACGTISVPHVPCKGEISLAEVRAEGAEFSVDRFAPGSAAACQPGAGEVFRLTPEGALAYTATYSGAKGVLLRTD